MAGPVAARWSQNRLRDGRGWINELLFGMSLTIEQLTDEVLALPDEARALLADRIVESLDPLDDKRIRDLWAAEAKRRVAEVRSGAVQPVDGEEVFAKARALLKT